MWEISDLRALKRRVFKFSPAQANGHYLRKRITGGFTLNLPQDRTVCTYSFRYFH